MLKPLMSLALALFASLIATTPAQCADPVLHVGSKRFTESYILGEILRQTAAPLASTEHLQGLGNTAILFNALKAGTIDVYPEYLGTVALEILHRDRPGSLADINRALAPLGLGAAVPLGFNNTYALAMRGAPAAPAAPAANAATTGAAAATGSVGAAGSASAAAAAEAAGSTGAAGSSVATAITSGANAASPVAPVPQKLSDLVRRPALKFGLSHEFIGRADGWPGLAARYGLPQQPRGLDHGISYEALRAGQVDVIDIYSTDAKIARLGLRVLADDLHFFPRYDALLLYRLDIAARFPAAWQAILALQGRIDEKAMIAMNGAAELDGKTFAVVAQEFLAGQTASAASAAAPANQAAPAASGSASSAAADGGATQAGATPAGAGAAAQTGAANTLYPSLPAATRPAGLAGKLFDDNLWRLTRQHLGLVLLSLLVATALGIPLGVLAASRPLARQVVLAVVGLLQTIPSLALLAMLIPLLGRIGAVPALVALCLYALLPIVRNTCAGLAQVSPGLRQAALALGLSKRQRLLLIDLPLAMPVILAGLKTAAVMSVGTATIAAFIGAGGYGERISIGLALNDNDMLLAGALPAAVLALLMQSLFELLEWLVYRRRSAGAGSPSQGPRS